MRSSRLVMMASGLAGLAALLAVAVFRGFDAWDSGDQGHSSREGSVTSQDASESISAAAVSDVDDRGGPSRAPLGTRRIRFRIGDRPAEEIEAIILPWTPEIEARARSAFGIPAPELASMIERKLADASGTMELERCSESVAIGARARGSAPAVRVVHPLDGDVEIELEPESMLTARAVAPDARPISGATVVARFDDVWSFIDDPGIDLARRALLPLFESNALSDSEGNVRLGGLARGPQRVVGSATNHASFEFNPFYLPQQDGDILNVVLHEQSASVEGVVRDAHTLAPLHDVSIEVREFYGLRELGSAARVFTDESGRFRVAGMWVFEGSARLHATKEGYASELVVLGRQTSGQKNEIEIALPLAGTFEGRVEADAAIARKDLAFVAADPGSWTKLEYARADASGTFHFSTLERDRAFSMMAGGKGIAWKFLTVPSPWPQPFVVKLEATSPLQGRLVADGYPLERPRVRLAVESRRTDRTFTAWTDADPATGEFTFADVGPGVYLIDAFAKGYAHARLAHLPVDAGSEREPVEIELVRGVLVRGIVREADTGAPIAGAKVALADRRVLGGDLDGAFEVDAETDPQGRFEMDSVPRGTKVGLVVTHTDFAERVDAFEAGPAASVVERAIELTRGGGLVVSAIRPDGKSSSHFDAHVSGADDRVHFREEIGDVLRFDGLAPGSYTVHVQLKDVDGDLYCCAKVAEGVEVRAGETRDITVDYRGGAVVRGHLLGGVAFAYEGGLTVQAFPESGGDHAAAIAMVRMSDLGFALYGMTAGAYRLVASTLDHEPEIRSERRVVVADGGEYTVDFDFGAGRLGGRVMSALGVPVSGAYVGLRASATDGEGSDAPATWHVAHSDADGRYSISGLRPQSHELIVAAEGYARAYGDMVIEERADPATRDFTLDPECRLRVFVADRGGNEVRDAAIALVPAARRGEDPIVGGRRDENGANVLHGVGTGDYLLRVERPGLFPHESTIACVAGGSLDVRVSLRRPTRLALRLRDAFGAPLKEAQVAIVDEETGEAIADWIARGLVAGRSGSATDADGFLAIEGVPEGGYRVLAPGIERVVEALLPAPEEPVALMAVR